MIYSAMMLSLSCLVSVSASVSAYIVPPAELRPSVYHGWAHKHWVWNHNSNNNQDSTLELVQGYLDHDIPVGAVDIDSMWETQFNNFEPNTDLFPDMASMISKLHDMDIRVITWATSMINVENPDFDMCVEKNYLVRDAFGVARPLGWWHGDGCLLDYSNPEAVAWWHTKMDTILDMGVDGFKTDGTDPYILEYIIFSGSALGYQNVSLTYRDYANAYYRDFFTYTREHRGEDGLIMSRPVDCQLDTVASLCTPFSPRDVMLSGWVGDDDATFNGLRGCMRKVIFSAWDGYANFGCDIGGYRGGDDTKDKELFVRWSQYGAFLPLMENGGGGEHRPWMYDEETTNIYRSFVNEHYRLIPYLLTNGMDAYDSDGNSTVIIPVAARAESTPNYRLTQPSTYSYLLGESLIVHPVAFNAVESESREGGSLVEMVFPKEGSDGEVGVWVDWWAPHDATLAVNVPGGAEYRTHRRVALDTYAVYARRGTILPLFASSSDETTLFTWLSPYEGSEAETYVREPASAGPGLIGGLSLSNGGVLSGYVSAHESKPHGGYGWVVTAVTEPDVVTFTGADVATCQHNYDGDTSTLTLTCSDGSAGLRFEATGVRSNF
mmetsp:Transcript_20348/g.29223  ORF Transcript_20348/g.29223 Transcript_20348/m.29223 type:complete len:607 (+) Transcript_20348:66-1886(+)